MRTVLFALYCCVCIHQGFTQSITYHRNIAPLIEKHCVSCHRDQGGAPFALTKYEQVAKRAPFIQHVTQSGYMPPWKANPDYRHFIGERVLTKEELNLIKIWVGQGMPEGKKKKPKTKIVSQQMAPKPDLILKMKAPVVIPGNNQSTYICYKMPYELPKDTFGYAIQFVPGNKKLAHHASCQLLSLSDDVDPYSSPDFFYYTDSSRVDDEHDFSYFKLKGKYGSLPKEMLHFGWLPGSSRQVYGSNIGYRIPKKGVLLIRNYHYGPTPVEQTDQSEIHIYFSPQPVQRLVQFAAFKPKRIFSDSTEWKIPADSIVTHFVKVKFHNDASLLAINPHMHLLGRYFVAYAVTPAQDTIPLIEIKDWDFNWQDFYRFQTLVKIPAGSILYGKGVFDNTTSNIRNPFYPPQPVYFERGMEDTDEMLRLVLLYLPYKEGDEELQLE